jgi:hypothetical protein
MPGKVHYSVACCYSWFYSLGLSYKEVLSDLDEILTISFRIILKFPWKYRENEGGLK